MRDPSGIPRTVIFRSVSTEHYLEGPGTWWPPGKSAWCALTNSVRSIAADAFIVDWLVDLVQAAQPKPRRPKTYRKRAA